MQPNEFVIWLKGFTEGVHEFNITPKQWDLMKDKLAEVKDDITLPPFPFGTPNTAPNTQSFPTWQQPHYVDPYNPYKITCAGTSGSMDTRSIVSQWTTTPNNVTYTVTSASAWSGGTAYVYPNGTTVSFTAGGANEFNNSKDKTLLND
jgi:hypothetical protein